MRRVGDGDFCALFRGYNVIFAESMFVGLALGCTVPGICKSYQIVSSRTEKWLPISPENPSSLRRFCLGFVGSRPWYFTILYISSYIISSYPIYTYLPQLYIQVLALLLVGVVYVEKNVECMNFYVSTQVHFAWYNLETSWPLCTWGLCFFFFAAWCHCSTHCAYESNSVVSEEG